MYHQQQQQHHLPLDKDNHYCAPCNWGAGCRDQAAGTAHCWHCPAAAVQQAALRHSFLAALQPATPAPQTFGAVSRRQQLPHESMLHCSIQINTLEVTTRSAHDPDTMLVQWFRPCAARSIQQNCTTVRRCLSFFFSLMGRPSKLRTIVSKQA